jgi:hypothetical protein
MFGAECGQNVAKRPFRRPLARNKNAYLHRQYV